MKRFHIVGRRMMTAGLATGVLLASTVMPAVAAVNPPAVDLTLSPGESADINKSVDTPTIPPKPDIYFLADTTGSMGGVIAQVQADATAVLAAIDAATPNARYGAGDYKDFPFDPYAFNNAAPIPGVDDDGAAALAAVGGWSAGGGADGSEGQFYALDQIASSVANFRADATKIVVWFGDAPAHDPVCSAISGLGYDIDEASVTAKLVAANIQVVAISTITGFPAGLDDDPTLSAGDYSPPCAIGGTAGQASRIAAATGGTHLTGVAPADIAAAILAGLGNLPITVTPQAVGCDPLNVSFAPASATVPSGTSANFVETIAVPADDSLQGTSVDCTVEFVANGEVIGRQTVHVTIPDTTPPVCECVETNNPSGDNTPKAGVNAGKSGQNPDGFYQLNATDNVDAAEDIQVFVRDTATGTVFGPFAVGTKIKYTQANGATPSQKPGAGDVDWKITGQGDAEVFAVDSSGNVSDPVACLVPAPPK